MQKNRFGLSFDFNDAPRQQARPCDHPGCREIGDFRAPKARDRLNEYWWFCLDHVRDYNKAWDFYAGMSEQEIEAQVRQDTTWQRPTWPMGRWRTQSRSAREDLYNGASPFGPEWDGEAAAEVRTRRPRTPEEEALAVLDLVPPVDFARIKARYRELAKAHHPDTNGGDKEAEERLKRINQAYRTLRASYAAG